MKTVTTTARVEGGKLQLRNRAKFAAELATLRDGEVVVTVEKKHATRSLDQNAWYWSQVVGLVAQHTGYTPDEIHEIYKAKFLPKELTFADGNGEIQGSFVIGGTTTRLNKLEFAEYCERIREWAAESLDVNIPDPDPAWREQGSEAA